MQAIIFYFSTSVRYVSLWYIFAVPLNRMNHNDILLVMDSKYWYSLGLESRCTDNNNPYNNKKMLWRISLNYRLQNIYLINKNKVNNKYC